MIITDKKALNKPCMPCKSLDEGLEIGKKLLDVSVCCKELRAEVQVERNARKNA